MFLAQNGLPTTQRLEQRAMPVGGCWQGTK